MDYLLAILFFIIVPFIIAAHLVSIGTPYIEESYCAGKLRYYVWIRQFFGYNHLAGSFDTEEEANKLFSEILKKH